MCAICKDGLPCGHPRKDALLIYAKSYARNGENVSISGIDGNILDVWIDYDPKPETMYVGAGKELWGYTATNNDDRRRKKRVGALLKEQNEKVVRAFLNRWDSFKEPPLWVKIGMIDEDVGRNYRYRDRPDAKFLSR
jgi:hypothetical protein